MKKIEVAFRGWGESWILGTLADIGQGPVDLADRERRRRGRTARFAGLAQGGVTDAEPPLRDFAGQIMHGRVDLARLHCAQVRRELADLREARGRCPYAPRDGDQIGEQAHGGMIGERMPKVPRHVLKRLLPLLWVSIAGLAAWVLIHRIEEIDFADVAQHLGNVPHFAARKGVEGNDVVDVALIRGRVATGGVLAVPVPDFDGPAQRPGEVALPGDRDDGGGSVEQDGLELGRVQPGDQTVGGDDGAVGQLAQLRDGALAHQDAEQRSGWTTICGAGG